MREQLVKNALAIWAENVDVNTAGGRRRITQFFTEIKSSRGASYWAHHLLADVSTDGIFNDHKRKGDRGQYCGLFIAYAGIGVIRPDIGYYCLPSTVRMQASTKWLDAGSVKPAWVSPADIQPGDIITVGTGKPYGTHLALVFARSGDALETVEANAHGLLGSGRMGRGVVKRVRSVGDVQRVYRLDERHFVRGESC